MKLKVVIGDTPAGGRVAYLADGRGEILPGQRDTRLDCPFMKEKTFTVTFLVGREIELVESAGLSTARKLRSLRKLTASWNRWMRPWR